MLPIPPRAGRPSRSSSVGCAAFAHAAASLACIVGAALPASALAADAGTRFGAAPPGGGVVRGLPAPNRDRDLVEAITAYARGDSRRAFAAYLRAARRGQPIGEYNVAVMSFNGEGTAVDEAAALRWLTSAAEKGFALAQYNLGLLYENGRGVEASQVRASAWFLKAAAQGHVDAELAIATQYLLGRGVARSDADAAGWYRRAAEGGNADAQYSLGSCYEHGDGVPVDRDLALRWYAEAGRQGDVAAQAKVAALVREAAAPRTEPAQR